MGKQSITNKESLKNKVYNFNLQLIGFQSFANFKFLIFNF
jgi:hypothetical protein